MRSWQRSLIVEHLERLRADRDAFERAGKTPPEYLLMAIRAAEAELSR